ncbi:MAG TPA: serine/threonine-protein kinase [Acidobacteriaceae bacterium]|nr:serine/threonine-protein kinase [Acidobacteriaceae bacterium]
MTPEQWSKVRTELETVLLVDGADRNAYLEGLAGRSTEMHRAVLDLLGAEPECQRLFDVDRWRDEIERAVGLSGLMIGKYRVLHEIGSGGMGAVYLAERADQQFEQRVALKLMREILPGRGALERFRRERQILAKLEHPGIARLLDGGVTDSGQPYAVMEYVEGLPIDQYCERHKLSVADRLRLFLQVAKAVEFAHRNLVLHLDLKPANILVTADGAARLLDFGISRILNETHTTELTAPLLTLQYASPEQLSGQPVGMASDEFSLATVLYKMLTGTLPYPIEGMSSFEAARVVRETAARPASEVAPPERKAELRGDLDIILLHALRKEPERRYGTVSDFARDVERYLASEPVAAHADSVRYRVSKFVRRHRGYVGVAAAALVIAMVSVVFVVRYAIVARRAENVAETRLKDVHDLAHTFIFDVDPKLDGIPGTVEARGVILKTGMKYLDVSAAASGNDDKLKMELAQGYAQLSQEQYNFLKQSEGDVAGAHVSQAKALALAENVLSRHPKDPKTIQDFIFVDLRNAQAIDEAQGDIPAYDAQLKHMWEVGQPLLTGKPTARSLNTMASIAGELATNRTGNGAMWNFADPRGGITWAVKSRELADRVVREYPNDVVATWSTVNAIYAELTIIDSSIYLGDENGVRNAYAELERRAQDPRVQDPRLAQVRHVIRDYELATAVLLRDLPKADSLLANESEKDRPEAGNNAKLDQQYAMQLEYRALLELAEGQKRGADEAMRSFDAMEALERTSRGDVGPRVQLLWMGQQLGWEPLIPAVERRRILERALAIAENYAPRYPQVLSAEIRIAMCNLLLGRLLREERKFTEAATKFEAARQALVIARKGVPDPQEVDLVESQVEAEASGNLDRTDACIQRIGARYFYSFLNGRQQIAACAAR